MYAASSRRTLRLLLQPTGAPLAEFYDVMTAVANDVCSGWRLELTGTSKLTAEIVWDTVVPPRVVGPAGATARLVAVSADPATVVEHRVLDVFTIHEVLVSLERLVITGGHMTAALRVMMRGTVSVAKLVAVRTSFVGDTPELRFGQGGAVNASVAVVSIEPGTSRCAATLRSSMGRCRWV